MHLTPSHNNFLESATIPNHIQMPSTTTVYTAIFGEYDNLLEIPEEFIESGVDYICFTDDPLLKSSTFKIIVVNDQEMSPSRSNRNFKINGARHLNDYNRSIYIDGNQAISGRLSELFDHLDTNNGTIAAFRHSRCRCSYIESADVIRLSLDDKAIVQAQMRLYESEQFPKNYGLAWNGLLIRYHTEKTLAFCDLWYQELLRHSFRDQLSLMYVSWKNDVPISIIDDDAKKTVRSRYVVAQPHINPKRR